MRKPLLVSILFAICVMFSAPKDHGQGRPIPPGVREADKASNAPIEPPARFERKATGPAILKQQADELAQISTEIPADIGRFAQGQLPKDLGNKLKRIEKLAKQLRTEIAP